MAPIPTTGAGVPWQSIVSGATELTRHEAQKFARGILESQAYRDNVATRATTGNLAPAIEAMLWHYAYGKPAEELNVNVKRDLSTLSPEDLVREYEEQLRALKEAEAIITAIPAEVVSSVA